MGCLHDDGAPAPTAVAKGRELQCKRPFFARRKAVFCCAFCRLLCHEMADVVFLKIMWLAVVFCIFIIFAS